MINEKQAIELAVKKGLVVSKTKKTKMNELDFWGKNIINYEIAVGNAICFYSTSFGGSACWRIKYNGQEYKSGYKGQAIMSATEMQNDY